MGEEQGDQVMFDVFVRIAGLTAFLMGLAIIGATFSFIDTHLRWPPYVVFPIIGIFASAATAAILCGGVLIYGGRAAIAKARRPA